MASAFRDMDNLTSLNLEGWDTRHLTGAQMFQMFGDSNELRVLTLGENWAAQGTPNQQGLVTPPSPRYTGRWQNVGEGTVDNPQGTESLTPAQLMTGAAGAGETWVWQRQQLTVTFEAGSNGTLAPAPPYTVTVLAGDTFAEAGISVPAPIPAEGYKFVYWTSPQHPDATFTTEQLLHLEMIENKEFTATFVPIAAIEVTFDLNGGFVGGVPYDTLREILPGNPITTAEVPVPTRIGWDFRGWRESGTGPLLSREAVGALVVTAPRTFIAQWDLHWNPGPDLPERQAYLIGAGNGLIRPNANVTRAEVATMLFRLITDEARAAYWAQENPFSDVALQDWFNNAVSTMTDTGVFNGLPDGSFAPDQTITRAEMATVIVRFMEQMGGMNLLENHFTDISGHWAEEYINAAAVNGWVQGPDGLGGAFYPDRPLTRAEVAAMINRISGRLVERAEDLLPNMQTWPDNTDVDEWYYFYIQSATNSYTFQWRGAGNVFERWVTLIPARNWAVLERPDSRPGDILS